MKIAYVAKITPEPDTLYYGDCLDIMEYFPDDWVDLICLDPPFNSNRNYNTIFKGSGLQNIDPQIKAFDDIWDWDDTSAERVERIKSAIANPASKVIQAFDLCIPQSEMLSYTSYMAERLFQMWRILKPTGSIYLHCDPYASHYLKIVMDAIFGKDQFQNEIIWYYKNASRGKKRLAKAHDVILWYSKLPEAYVFNRDDILVAFESGMTEWRYTKGGQAGQEMPEGKTPDDVIVMPALNAMAKERLDYPTQKPLALYEWIVKTSSTPGDIVLDPFCGCGTTIEAAQKLGRRAIGIDILPFALNLVNNKRLKPNGLSPLDVQGIPVDRATAYNLADNDPFKFQDWAVSLIDGFAANPKKTGDDGIDGFGMMLNKPDNMDQKAILVQVTGAKGAQKAKYERLQATVRNHNAAMGILITRDAQTAQRHWQHTLQPIEMGFTRYDPIQCLSIEEYYRNSEQYEPPLRLPPLTDPWTGKPMQTTLFDSV